MTNLYLNERLFIVFVVLFSSEWWQNQMHQWLGLTFAVISSCLNAIAASPDTRPIVSQGHHQSDVERKRRSDTKPRQHVRFTFRFRFHFACSHFPGQSVQKNRNSTKWWVKLKSNRECLLIKTIFASPLQQVRRPWAADRARPANCRRHVAPDPEAAAPWSSARLPAAPRQWSVRL